MTGGATLTICGSAILVVILAAISALAWHGVITGSNAMEAIIAVIGIAGGAVSHASGVSAGASAASTSGAESPKAPRPEQR